MTLYGLEHPFGQLRSAVPAVSPTSLLLIHCGAEEEAEKTLTLCKSHLAIAKRLVCYQDCFIHKSKTQRCVGCSEEN